MAFHNGEKWVEEQLTSILYQNKVLLDVIIGNDNSSQESTVFIENLVKNFPNVSSVEIDGGSPANTFYKLICYSNPDKYDFFAFSDQDDIWMPEKLLHSINIMNKGSYAGSSSLTLPFSHTGISFKNKHTTNLKKYDHFFQACGPGCTYTLNKAFFIKLKKYLLSVNNYNDIQYHDWFIYAFTRSSGGKWKFINQSTIFYRIHDSNIHGLPFSKKGLAQRIHLLIGGPYAKQTLFLIANFSNNALNDRLKKSKVRLYLFLFFNFRQTRRSLLSAIFQPVIFFLSRK